MSRRDRVVHERAVLVGVLLPEHQSLRQADDPLDELKGLATTAGATPVAEIVQRRNTPDQATYLGKGKLEELVLLVEGEEADVVIFDNDLSPAQIRNLEQAVNVKVLDRTELILDIFATHAQTHEARLAVELAQLQYSLPRLKRMWTHLSRLKMGIGMRGPGEKQLEVDRRLAEKRIHELKSLLSEIQQRKERQVAARHDRLTVSLVGYTNAGKSTLMNTLTEAEVLAEDKLFATLDTRTRRWHLPGWGPVLLSDTVGFIRDLPHNLIASFKATLEEARQADLLMHVADASSLSAKEQISAVYDVLEELGINQKDALLILNKIDAVDRIVLEGLMMRYPHAVAVSARTGEGLQQLAAAVSEAMSREFLDIDVETDVSDGKTVAMLSRVGEVLSKQYTETQVKVHCRIPKQFLGQIQNQNQTVKVFQRKGRRPKHATGNGSPNGSHGANGSVSNT